MFGAIEGGETLRQQPLSMTVFTFIQPPSSLFQCPSPSTAHMLWERDVQPPSLTTLAGMLCAAPQENPKSPWYLVNFEEACGILAFGFDDTVPDTMG